MDLAVGIGVLGEGENFAEGGIERSFVTANPAQVLDDDGQAGKFLGHLLEEGRGESVRRAEATDRDAQLGGFALDRQGVIAGRPRGRAEADAFGTFACPARQSLGGIGVVGIDDDHGAEAPRKAPHALHEVAIVELPSDLHQRGFIHPVCVHLVQEHLHRFEPMGQSMAMRIHDDHEAPPPEFVNRADRRFRIRR